MVNFWITRRLACLTSARLPVIKNVLFLVCCEVVHSMFVAVLVLMEVMILMKLGRATFNWSSASKEKASCTIPEDLFLGAEPEEEGADTGAETDPVELGPQEEAELEIAAGEDALDRPPNTGKADSSFKERGLSVEAVVSETGVTDS